MIHKHIPPGRVKPKAGPIERNDVIERDGTVDDVPEIGLGSLPQSLGYALRRAQLAVFNDFIETLERVDLRPGQFSALVLIGENPGIVQQRVCAALGIKAANFVPMFAELERRRLVKRISIDGRSKGLYVTAKGRTLLAKAQALSDSHEERIRTRVGRAEHERVIAALFRIAGLAETSGSPALARSKTARAARASY